MPTESATDEVKDPKKLQCLSTREKGYQLKLLELDKGIELFVEFK